MPITVTAFNSHLEAHLQGQVTSLEVSRLRECLAEGSMAYLVDLEKLQGFPSHREFPVVFGCTPFSTKKIAFVCSDALSFGFARMIASYCGIDDFKIFTSRQEGLHWLTPHECSAG